MTMQEEGVSFGSAADRLSGPGVNPPTPAAPAGFPTPTAGATAAPAPPSTSLLRRQQPPPPLRRQYNPPPPSSASTGGDRVRPRAASAIPAATCLAKAMMVIIGLTWTAVGKSEASAT